MSPQTPGMNLAYFSFNPPQDGNGIVIVLLNDPVNVLSGGKSFMSMSVTMENEELLWFNTGPDEI